MRKRTLLPLCAVFLFSSIGVSQVHESVLYSFGSAPDDAITPNGGLVFDSAGNIYGTTQRGGPYGASGPGAAFELSPASNGTWTESILYQFCSLANCVDGSVPKAGLIFDKAGNLYGTTTAGGTFSGGVCHGGGCGTVFELSPPSIPGENWTETVLWNFQGELHGDGAGPSGRLVWDAAGNLYGTTTFGGSALSLGTAFQLRKNSDGTWNESVIYEFCVSGPPCSDGVYPMAGLTFDKSGNLYGTTYDLWGAVFELSPQPSGTWTETTLHQFAPHQGGNPISEVNFDQSGNLYGTVSDGETSAQCGGVWKLVPQPEGGFKEGLFLLNQSGANGCTPGAGVFMDSRAKTILATASGGSPYKEGTVFRITGGQETILYEFCQLPNCSDGSTPAATFTGHGGALFSTTLKGGAFNQGVVFELVPGKSH